MELRSGSQGEISKKSNGALGESHSRKDTAVTKETDRRVQTLPAPETESKESPKFSGFFVAYLNPHS